MNIVILAGGQGTRLWPLSRRRVPKQFLALLTERAMLVDCYERVRPLAKTGGVFVSCVAEQVPLIKQLLPQVPPDRYIVEPARRDSGPAMAFAAATLVSAGFGDQPVAFVPTDHAIGDDEVFRNTLAAGAELVAETKAFADIGVVPTEPLSTLGYTKIGPVLGQRRGVDYHGFLGHIEKPTSQKAAELIASGEYLWHANYYMATPSILLAAYQQHAPEIAKVMTTIDAQDQAWQQAYARLPRISIDHAVTEKLPPNSMHILRGAFRWNDVGQFGQLHRWLTQGKPGLHASRGQHVAVDSSGCLVIGRPDKMVATIGIHNTAIIDTGDALLVCDLSKAADVKRLVDWLAENGHDKLL